MALAGVDHDAGGAPGGERGRTAEVAPEPRDVVAERFAEAAGLEEIALHIDDEERRGYGIEADRRRFRSEQDRHARHSSGEAWRLQMRCHPAGRNCRRRAAGWAARLRWASGRD